MFGGRIGMPEVLLVVVILAMVAIPVAAIVLVKVGRLRGKK